MEPYRYELLELRQHDASIKEKYGVRSLDDLICRSEEKLANYYERQGKGEPMPDVTIQQELKKKEDLIRKKERLVRSVEAETHLLPHDPGILGIDKVTPLDTN
mgnify:CR=1 FL=1